MAKTKSVYCPNFCCSAIASAWTSRCQFEYKRQCEGLKMWNGNCRFLRFFCWSFLVKREKTETEMIMTATVASMYNGAMFTLWGQGEMRALLSASRGCAERVMPLECLHSAA